MPPKPIRRDRNKHYSTYTRTREQTHSRRFFGRCWDRPPSMFSLIRAIIYSLVLIWTFICLAISIHLVGVLIPSDLTRFVPFATFVCSGSVAIFITLLAFGLRRDRNPITTRIELGCLGLALTLWLALGTFMMLSDSGKAEVECYTDSSQTTIKEDDSFTTGIFLAQYRVMESACVFNIVLIGLFALFLLCLVLRQHFDGKREAWSYPVTTFPWFTAASKKSKLTTLPSPVLASRGRSRSQSQRTEKHWRASSLGKERGRKGHSRPGYPERTYGRHTSTRHTKGRTLDSYRSPDLTSPTHDKYHRNASPRR